MPIPDYQSIFYPLLDFASDRQDHTVKETVQPLAHEFSLTEEELSELLPSRSPKFKNRVAWAKTYLTKAKLLETTNRGHFIITERGLDLIKQGKTSLRKKDLEQYPEFKDFMTSTKTKKESAQEENNNNETPEETLESAYQKIRDSLAHELLDQVISESPDFFEQLVVDLVVAMGYGGSIQDAGKAIGRTGDEGIDGTIKEDKLGLDVIYIQAKRWNNTVGRPSIQQFAGALQGKKARKGIFITTADFSNQARDYVRSIDMKIVLIDGKQLAQLMIDHNIGVSQKVVYSIKAIDTDYFN